MDVRQNPLWLSFSIGRWFHTDVRVSFFFPLLLVVFCYRLGVEVGMAVTGLLFVSILLHEFGHILAARMTGGTGDEILMWPLGGLAFVSPASNFSSEGWTALSGPLVNLVLCIVTLPVVLSHEMLRDSISLIYIPIGDLTSQWPAQLAILMFSLNFKLLMLNLLPIYPLDGGQFSYSVAKLYWDRQTARISSLWLGLLIALIVAMAGFMLEITDLVMIGLLLGMICQYQYIIAQASSAFGGMMDEGEYSDGYFAGSSPSWEDEDDSPRPGPLKRWKQAREEKRRAREEQERVETARRVDELLDKVHQHGMDALSESERRFLQRASNNYRKTEQ
ncbi:MAG: hypothetical protein KDA80_15045 [Planctomycetaceae bacterium]|nr:hypothetical protein [Planctomycetaceae bacterium]